MLEKNACKLGTGAFLKHDLHFLATLVTLQKRAAYRQGRKREEEGKNVTKAKKKHRQKLQTQKGQKNGSRRGKKQKKIAVVSFFLR